MSAEHLSTADFERDQFNGDEQAFQHRRSLNTSAADWGARFLELAAQLRTREGITRALLESDSLVVKRQLADLLYQQGVIDTLAQSQAIAEAAP